ncbi:DUF3099 domain-containing protein [Cryobacterium arcticum]|uniref:DUF3099 domain-containing protein n=1 Tax=Cryobacterium arcticum TaxID=670052 RepID=A0A1B1BJG2_9MICO|nr:DUF3099 domain-containing protein [Cryobacterium arcticum]ANP72742.1 hypothetical protein PA27867_1789 [Cryobacterium arcticum]
MGTMKQQQSITTLPPSPDEERRSRMIKYTVTMGIRMVCIVLMLFVHGWWLLVCALGAILLPYFAVIAANVHGEQRTTPVLRPGAIVLSRAEAPDDRAARPDTVTPDETAPAAGGEDAR